MPSTGIERGPVYGEKWLFELPHADGCDPGDEVGIGRCEELCPAHVAGRALELSSAHLDPETGMPWELRDRRGGWWMWGFDAQCQRWGYREQGSGHARTLAELQADDDPEWGLAPVERVPWAQTPRARAWGRGDAGAHRADGRGRG